MEFTDFTVGERFILFVFSLFWSVFSWFTCVVSPVSEGRKMKVDQEEAARGT